ncbi:PKD domain-containing protein [Undibacterium fentianense]|uniref:PKD domain-containing protein n=1 Tax=Undibacterium fentianense TaxID=2828728 RepID=A0A941E0Z4_9BURK|nr:PKD domain-containing protein [Undibacterium fentianense]MBR7800360.1 PKD domain-containing protein [Undibacterium fentianense]
MKQQIQTGRATLSLLAILLLVGAGCYALLDFDESTSSSIQITQQQSAKILNADERGILVQTGQEQANLAHAKRISADITEISTSGQRSQINVSTSAQRAVLLGQIGTQTDLLPSNAQGQIDNAPFNRIFLPEISSGQRAITLLGDQLAVVAQWYGMSVDTMRELMLRDSTIHLDRKGRLLHIDKGAGEIQTSSPVVNGRDPNAFDRNGLAGNNFNNALYPLGETFTLHSKPESTRIMYLNFKGLGDKPAFDLDGIVGTFNDNELTNIQTIWARVKEDFAPFDVDVTTEAPTVLTGKIGTSILITNLQSDAGGYAYLNSFGSINLNNPPAFCFQNNLANYHKYIAECISHELGHTLGLYHQGSTGVEYYAGQGSGETGWAPIMGVGYYQNLTQWSKGEYANPSNQEDAYATMLVRGLSPRTDDVGNTIATASAMVSTNANGFNNLSASGVIEKPGDVDVYSFVGSPGEVSFTLVGSIYSGNLDASIQLSDASGRVIATSNDLNTLGTTLNANLTANGTYYLSVTGVGKGDPKTTGYTNYGSLGQYAITGKSIASSQMPPVIKVTNGTLTGKRKLTVNFDASKSVPMSGAKIMKYEWTFGDGTALGKTAKISHTYSKIGNYTTTLKITDSNNLTATQIFKIAVTK